MTTNTIIGTVVALYIAKIARAPMQEVQSVNVTETGFEDDRYEKGKGTYQTQKELRPITLIDIRQIIAANSRLAIPFGPEETRRNAVVRLNDDVDLVLTDLIGNWLQIGDDPDGAIIEITVDCTPCEHPAKLAGKSGFRAAFTPAGGGVRAKVIKTGKVKVGDPLILVQKV